MEIYVVEEIKYFEASDTVYSYVKAFDTKEKALKYFDESVEEEFDGRFETIKREKDRVLMVDDGDWVEIKIIKTKIN